MPASKHDIIRQLQKDILPLQGFKPPSAGAGIDVGLGGLEAAFPNATFPTGAVHEFISDGAEDAAATGGFVAGLLGALMRGGGVCVWVSASRTLFPPSLKTFGIEPDRIIFVDLKRERDVLWAMEEALKCGGLASVVGEIQEIGFTASRRLQLAVEQSRVTGFILRNHPRNLGTVACVSRWRITHLASEWQDDMPGVGFPRWNVELLKIRNGRPGVWQMEWEAGRFNTMVPEEQRHETQRRKTG